MKGIKIDIAAIAFITGSSCAVASALTVDDVYVRAKLVSNPAGMTQCVNTGVQCLSFGVSVCTVVIPITGGSTTVSTGSVFKPYRGSSCQTELTHVDSYPQTSTVFGIDTLVPSN